MEDLASHPRYKEARRYARAVRGFYVHALVFVLVNGGLATLHLLHSPERAWFGWSMAWWGVGLLAHGLSVFLLSGRLGRDWEERQVRSYLDRRG